MVVPAKAGTTILCRATCTQDDWHVIASVLCYVGSKPTGAIVMSMQNVAPALPFTAPRRNELTHIPGDEGWPIIGKTLEVLADPKGHIEKTAAKYGLVFRSHMFGETSIVLLGPEANELVMFDQAKLSPPSTAGGAFWACCFRAA
jgi:hypothetical protein